MSIFNKNYIDLKLARALRFLVIDSVENETSRLIPFVVLSHQSSSLRQLDRCEDV